MLSTNITTISKIMVVDDSDDIRELIRAFLQMRGYEISTATDGVDALEKLKKDQIPLIITDINMPRMNGPELLEAISKSSQDYKAVVMSTYIEDEVKNDLRKKGAVAFLLKPFSLHQLEEIVSASLS
ncbi:MAG: response regulator [Desulfobacterota bacterium]|nr:response regulator [Thermodesulfobacteriota bacterium]